MVRKHNYGSRPDVELAARIGAQYSLPPTDDKRLRELVGQYLGAASGAPAPRVRADQPGHTPGYQRNGVVADVRREVAQLAAEDRADSARAVQRKRAETPVTNAELAWRARLRANDDLKNRDAWSLVALALDESRSRAGAASRLLGFAIKEGVRARALEAFTTLLDD